jgi:hypothetical protein
MSIFEVTGILGNVGEFLGALAVMVTLLILVLQVRQSARAVEESNRLQRSAALDRHSDSIGNWRMQVAGSSEAAAIWLKGGEDTELSTVERLRLNFLWICYVNMHRSNYIRAQTVGDSGLARQAVLAIAVEASLSNTFRDEWQDVRGWSSLASAEFVDEVDRAMSEYAAGGNTEFPPGARLGAVAKGTAP